MVASFHSHLSRSDPPELYARRQVPFSLSQDGFSPLLPQRPRYCLLTASLFSSSQRFHSEPCVFTVILETAFCFPRFGSLFSFV